MATVPNLPRPSPDSMTLYLEWMQKMKDQGLLKQEGLIVSPYQLGIDPADLKKLEENERGEEVDEEQEKEMENRYAVVLMYEDCDGRMVIRHMLVEAVSDTEALGQAVQTFQHVGNLVTFSVLKCSVKCSPLEMRILELLKEGKKINAIKAYREETNVGLKEAKDWVDNKAEVWREEGILPL